MCEVKERREVARNPALSGDLHHEQRRDRSDVAAPSEQSFGITFACVFALITAWLLYRNGVGPGPLATGAIACVFLLHGYLAPRLLGPLNRLWLRFGLVLHAVVNPLILGLLFFVVFTPIGLVIRLFGGDLLRLRRGAGSDSYWIFRAEEKVAPSSMTNQF
jgi:hypothetical protein